MRTGDTQSVPSNTPDIYLEIQTGTPEDVSSRVVKFKFDEQVYGGVWEIWLDNADSSLSAKDYVGYDVDLEIGFSGGTRSQYPKLWIDTQEFESIGGKLLLKLIIIDAWGLLARVNSNVGAQYWNYPELAPGEPDADSDYYDKTIENIVTSVIQSALDNTFALDKDDDDNYYDTLKPPIRITNAREGVFQLMEMTDSFLRYENDNDFHVIQASKQSTVYTFDLSDNEVWITSDGSGVTIPNRVIFHGSSDPPETIADMDSDYAGGHGVDSTSYTRVGIYIDRHYYYGRTEVQLIDNNQTLLDSLADAAIAKIQGQRAQGSLIAPMHCSLELLDKVVVNDSRYSGTKTITGYVHRMIREYEANSGLYRITIQLGGAASAYTPTTGGAKTPRAKHEDSEPNPMGLPFTPEPAYLPCVIDIPFTVTDWDTIAWTAGGTIKTAAGHSYTISADAGNVLDLADDDVVYLYYDTDTDDGALDNTKTFTNTVAHERILVAFCRRGTSGNDDAMVVAGTSGQDFFVDKLSAITADMGLLTAGEIRVGTGTLGSNFTGFRLWVESSVGVIGGYNSDSLTWYSDTNGKLIIYGAGNLNAYVSTTHYGSIDAQTGTPAYYSFLAQSGIIARVKGDGVLIDTIGSGDDIDILAHDDLYMDAAGDDFRLDFYDKAFFYSDTDSYVYIDDDLIVNNDFDCYGVKDCAHKAPDGKTYLFAAVESPDVWFEEKLSGQLTDGLCEIALDVRFLLCIHQPSGLHTVATPTSECKGLWVEKKLDRVIVHELDSGKSNATFDIVISAKRDGKQDCHYDTMEYDEEADTFYKKSKEDKFISMRSEYIRCAKKRRIKNAIRQEKKMRRRLENYWNMLDEEEAGGN